MAKQVRRAPELQAPGATIVEPEIRNVKDEQESQQQTLDTLAAQRQRDADRAAQVTADADAARKADEAKLTAAQKAAHDAEMRRPLTPWEQAELVELEKLAMQPGNRPPETMHRLSDLRERSKVSPDVQTT